MRGVNIIQFFSCSKNVVKFISDYVLEQKLRNRENLGKTRKAASDSHNIPLSVCVCLSCTELQAPETCCLPEISVFHAFWMRHNTRLIHDT